MPSYLLCQSDARTIPLPDRSVHCVVTSPPYFGLRDYSTGRWEGGDDPACDHAPRAQVAGCLSDSGGPLRDKPSNRCRKCGARRIDRQIGLESSIEAYVDVMVRVFREVRRVLRDDGTCWINLGDSYANMGISDTSKVGGFTGDRIRRGVKGIMDSRPRNAVPGLAPKNLLGMPWTVAKALQAPYYAGRIKSELDRVWLAATIDAEGTICGFSHVRKDEGRTRTGVYVAITNTSQAMLDNAFRIWPTSRQDHNPHGKGHYGSLDVFRWIAHSVDSKAMLLRELYPYLITKKKQALLAWNLLEMSKVAKRMGKTTQANEIRGKRAWIVSALSQLNHMKNVDIPSWCKEPPSLLEPGWILRSDIIWAKANPMPESVTDRPTKSHEYLFLLSKQSTYFYDAEAVREKGVYSAEQVAQQARAHKARAMRMMVRSDGGTNPVDDFGRRLVESTVEPYGTGYRNMRSVLSIPTESFPGAHFATFPRKLVEPCIKAGSSERGCCPRCGAGWRRVVERTEGEDQSWKQATGATTKHASRIVQGLQGERSGLNKGSKEDYYANAPRSSTLGWVQSCQCPPHAPVPCTILDPFAGSGTTLVVANALGRRAIGLDLSREYLVNQAQRRLERPHAPHISPARVEPAMPLFGDIDP